jgi:hypothetical protein
MEKAPVRSKTKTLRLTPDLSTKTYNGSRMRLRKIIHVATDAI